MKPGQRSIALCVDDFGLHAGVNAAVLRLASLQRINAVACMVGAPSWRAAREHLASLEAAGVEIGLHLDFTEFPLDATLRRALPVLQGAAYAGRLDESRLRAEIERQHDALEHALGHAPAFVDGHQHVHQLPMIRRLLFDVLGSRAGSPRPWLRSTRPAPRGNPRRAPATLAQRVKPRLISALGGAALSHLARAGGYPQNHHLLGVYNFSGDAQHYRALLHDWLARASDGDLLMCHPSEACEAHDVILHARITEYVVLTSPAFLEMLDEAGVTLRPMRQILDAARR